MARVLHSNITIPAVDSSSLIGFCNAISCDIPTACKLSGISRSFLYEVLARGDVHSVKAGKKRLIIVESLRVWLHSLPTEGLTPPTQSNKQKPEPIKAEVPVWRG
jgi:excisionase family DNA binding protein